MALDLKILPAIRVFGVCLLIVISVWLGTPSVIGGTEGATDLNRFPEKGKVTLIDLGSDSCIPCKMMAPILEKLKERYQDKAEIVVIDVYKHRDQAKRFKIRAIPTQIFFDENGDEVFRHMGFMSEKDIVSKLREMGVE